MGKLIVIIGFLIFFVISLYLFFTKPHVAPLDALKSETTKTPRIILADFTFYKYEKGTLSTTLSSRLGYLNEPNSVELFGNVRAVNHKSTETETVRAETGIAYFQTDSLGRLLQESELDRAELKGSIEVDFHNHKLTTDYIEFLSKERIAQSSKPTRIDGANRWFTGQNGFRYDLNKEEINFLGPIEGEVIPSSLKKH